MKRSKETANRVWIGLEAHNDDAINVTRGKLATVLIQRLGSTSEIYWNEKTQDFILRREGGEFTELGDNGYWFNLDYFGRD